MISNEKRNEIANEVKKLLASNRELKGCLVISYSGQLLYSVLSSEMNLKNDDIRNFAAFIQRYLDELEMDESFDYTVSRFFGGGHIIMWKGLYYILTAFTSLEINLGSTLFGEFKWYLSKIDEILAELNSSTEK
ncbi:hypothetical protein ES705_07234 [subsurface metagenome]